MPTVRAIFENGVFRPIEPVDLPERGVFEFEPHPVPNRNRSESARRSVFAILAERYHGGEPDVAARHDEHQP